MNTVIVLLALLATASAFVANTGAARSLVKANKMSMKMDLSKIAAIAPFVATPAAFASVDVSFTIINNWSMYSSRKVVIYRCNRIYLKPLILQLYSITVSKMLLLWKIM